MKTGRQVEWWTTPDDLAQKLSVSLHKQMDRKKRPGWVRADSFNIEESHAEILTLNKRVRDLEAENKKLSDELQGFLQQASERQPKLELMIRVDTIDDELGKMCHPVFAPQDENALMKGVRILRLSADREDDHYKAITIDDFPSGLRNVARQDEINAYNNSLPSAEVIDAYKKSLVNYAQITQSCVHISIGVCNNGTAKACNVSATIEFPDGVDVYDQDILHLDKPKAPRVGKNPIELAEKRRRDPWGVSFDRSYADLQIPQSMSGGGLLKSLIASQNANYKCFKRNHSFFQPIWVTNITYLNKNS